MHLAAVAKEFIPDNGSDGRQLLAGKELHREDIGELICSCHEVGEQQIIKAIQSGCGDHVKLGEKLRCGTNCGSCIPELTQLVSLYKDTLPAQVIESKAS